MLSCTTVGFTNFQYWTGCRTTFLLSWRRALVQNVAICTLSQWCFFIWCFHGTNKEANRILYFTWFGVPTLLLYTLHNLVGFDLNHLSLAPYQPYLLLHIHLKYDYLKKLKGEIHIKLHIGPCFWRRSNLIHSTMYTYLVSLCMGELEDIFLGINIIDWTNYL